MSSRLPQSGWYLDKEWAEALEKQVKTFRSWVRKSGIPYKACGDTLMIYAEEFYRHCPPGDDYGEEEEG